MSVADNPVDLASFQQFLRELVEESGQSYRRVSQAAGLHYTAISKYLGGTTPGRDACIALADHFGINPNRMLVAAGYEPLRFFDKVNLDLSEVSPETLMVAEKLERLRDPRDRKLITDALGLMIDGYVWRQGQMGVDKLDDETEAS